MGRFHFFKRRAKTTILNRIKLRIMCLSALSGTNFSPSLEHTSYCGFLSAFSFFLFFFFKTNSLWKQTDANVHFKSEKCNMWPKPKKSLKVTLICSQSQFLWHWGDRMVMRRHPECTCMFKTHSFHIHISPWAVLATWEYTANYQIHTSTPSLIQQNFLEHM